jgi:hypothetical protein
MAQTHHFAVGTLLAVILPTVPDRKFLGPYNKRSNQKKQTLLFWSNIMSRITLAVNFHVDQRSVNLNWAFKQNGVAMSIGNGNHSGAWLFGAGDVLGLELTAHMSEPCEVSIVDCHLINAPALDMSAPAGNSAGNPVGGYLLAPSPFFVPDDPVLGGAVINFACDGFHGARSPDGGQRQIANRSLTVRNRAGSWELSFIMTVKIVSGRIVRYRVFSFDPEVQVGSGL